METKEEMITQEEAEEEKRLGIANWSAAKKIIVCLVLAAAVLASVFFGLNKASSPEFYPNTLQSLNEKKMQVSELTLVIAGAATAVAAVPGDATTPLANQIARLSSYLLIVVGALFLEKMLVTLTGYVTFTFLLPAAFVLGIIYIWRKKELLKGLAIKLFVFGVVIFLVVPVSVKISDIIDKTSQIPVEEEKTEEIVAAEDYSEISEDGEAQEKGIIDTITDKIKDTVSEVEEKVSSGIEEGKKQLNAFIDKIAVMIVINCVIPLVVLFLLWCIVKWIVKAIFGIGIELPKRKKKDKTKE